MHRPLAASNVLGKTFSTKVALLLKRTYPLLATILDVKPDPMGKKDESHIGRIMGQPAHGRDPPIIGGVLGDWWLSALILLVLPELTEIAFRLTTTDCAPVLRTSWLGPFWQHG